MAGRPPLKKSFRNKKPFARKRFGQNFLIDKNVVHKIINESNVSGSDHIVEIGPGRGHLTDELLKTNLKKLTAIELDRDLAPLLREKYKDNAKFSLLEEDALRTDFTTLAHGDKIKLIANLPYNISVPLIFLFMEEKELYSEIIIMVQKEVAKRLTSNPSTKDYGVLGIMCQIHFKSEILFDVPPTAFKPAPKVTSTVIKLTPLKETKIDVGDEKIFKKMIKAIFQTRRKTIYNGLKNAFDAETAKKALNMAKIDEKVRGETLFLEDFSRLAKALITV